MFSTCPKCEVETFAIGGDSHCHDCYQPADPTVGWLVSQYHERQLPLEELSKASKLTKARLETFLRQSLGLSKPPPRKKEVITNER